MASQDVQVPNDETPMTTSGSSQSRSEGCQLKGGVAPGGTAPPLGREGGDSLAPLGRACRGTGLWARSPRRPAVTYGFFRGPWNPVLLRTPPHPPTHAFPLRSRTFGIRGIRMSSLFVSCVQPRAIAPRRPRSCFPGSEASLTYLWRLGLCRHLLTFKISSISATVAQNRENIEQVFEELI